MSQSKRLLELDVLRGIAALGVVFYHYTHRFENLYDHSDKLLIDFSYGSYGVEIFFIISGFVILISLERTKRDLDFIVRRFSRIYPAYWIAVISTFTIVTIAGLPDRKVNLQDALINLTLLQKYLHVPRVDGVYWTLELQLGFYVLMFIIYKAKLLKYLDKITIGWLFLMVATIVLEEQFGLHLGTNIKRFLLLNHANLFIAGIMLYKIHCEGFSAKRYAIIAACGLVYGLNHSWNEVLIFILFILVLHLLIRGNLAFINQKPLIFLGSISYTLYLIHQNIGYVIIRKLDQLDVNSNLSIFIAIVLVMFLASLITFLFEQPMTHFIIRKYQTRILRQT